MKIATRMRPSTTTKAPVVSIGSQFVISAGADLEEHQREADRDREREDDLAARDLGRDLAVVVLLLRGVVRGDRERAEPDRERLAERDHAADDGQPEEPVARHRRARCRLTTWAISPFACGRRRPSSTGCASSRPRGRPALRSCSPRPCSLSRGGRRRPSRAGAGSARRGRRCPSASACRCRTGGRRSRSRRGGPASWSASGTRCRRSSERWSSDVLGMDVGLHGSRQDSSGGLRRPRCRPRPRRPSCPRSICPARSGARPTAAAGSHASFARA